MNTAGQGLSALYLQNFGYLSAADIALWADPQLIISALNRNPNAVTKAVRTALSLVSSKLMNIYDLKQEFLKSDSVSAQLTASLTAGAVSGVVVAGAGTNYVQAPTIQVVAVGAGAGAGAALTAQISPSVLQSLELTTPGGGYKQPPGVVFEGGGGTGATAVTTIDKFGRVSSVRLLDGGEGWTSIPDVLFVAADGFGCGASAAASVLFGKVTGATIDDGGAAYTVPPTLVLSGGQVEDVRNDKLVMICAINAVRVIMGNGASISEKMKGDFKMGDDLLHEMLNGTGSLPLLTAGTKLRSTMGLVKDRFDTRG